MEIERKLRRFKTILKCFQNNETFVTNVKHQYGAKHWCVSIYQNPEFPLNEMIADIVEMEYNKEEECIISPDKSMPLDRLFLLMKSVFGEDVKIDIEQVEVNI
jgi:hypothetical protein